MKLTRHLPYCATRSNVRLQSVNGLGNDFNQRKLTVLLQPPGKDSTSPGTTKTAHALHVQIPRDLQCFGGFNGQMCIVRCRNKAAAGPFGSCAPIVVASGPMGSCNNNNQNRNPYQGNVYAMRPNQSFRFGNNFNPMGSNNGNWMPPSNNNQYNNYNPYNPFASSLMGPYSNFNTRSPLQQSQPNQTPSRGPNDYQMSYRNASPANSPSRGYPANTNNGNYGTQYGDQRYENNFSAYSPLSRNSNTNAYYGQPQFQQFQQ
jgi:hypothetical protein